MNLDTLVPDGLRSVPATPNTPPARSGGAVPPAAAPAASGTVARWRMPWWLALSLFTLVYAALFALYANAALPRSGLESPAAWAAMALLHLPYLIILAMLGFGLVERVGYFWRGRRPHPPGRLPAQVPTVCIQLPMFNEHAVASRIIEAAAAIRWPRERLSIQVLDDSTDAATRALVQAVCDRVRRTQGVRCTWVHRPRRTGYKAGALEHGRQETDAEFIAIFDADFVPPPDYLERAMPHFYDADGRPVAERALVQAQWGHLNDDESALTAAQALWVDDHHTLQMAFRSASIGFVNFTGTAGVWRASAIESVGGWRAASLVEDCELSIRVLLRGWRTRFVRQLAVPAELPQTLDAYRLQQKRWTQGWVQLQRLHLLPLLLHYRTTPLRKALLVYLVCIAWQWPLWTLWITLLPLLIASGLWLGSYGLGAALLAYALPPLLFALLAGVVATLQTRHGQGSCKGSALRRCGRILPYLAIHTGMVPHHFCAFVEGLFGPLHAEFERTPKTASVTAAATPAAPASAAVAAAAAAATPAARPKPGRHAYRITEAVFVAAQLSWLVYFAAQGLWLATLGALWVVGCVGGLRIAPRVQALVAGLRRPEVSA